jgi:hypothetical protein
MSKLSITHINGKMSTEAQLNLLAAAEEKLFEDGKKLMLSKGITFTVFKKRLSKFFTEPIEEDDFVDYYKDCAIFFATTKPRFCTVKGFFDNWIC